MNPTLPEADRIDEKQRNIILNFIIIIQYIFDNFERTGNASEQQKVEKVQWANIWVFYVHFTYTGAKFKMSAKMNYENW